MFLDPKGILCKQTSRDHPIRICLPISKISKTLESLHNTNHSGGNNLAQVVSQRFFFPKLVSTCREFVATCPRCQRQRQHDPQRHTYAHDLVGSPGEKLCIDFVGPLHRTRSGNVAILTAVDCYTKWFEAWPVKDQTAKTVIKHLTRDYIPRHGVPATVHSDNGPAFIAKVFKAAMQRFDIRATTTPIYNACSNTVERYHRTLNTRLKALIHEMNEEWDELLPAVLFAMRTSVNRTTGYTAFFLQYGREARLPIDLVYGSIPIVTQNIDEYVNRLHTTFQLAYQIVAQRQNDYILRQRALYQEKAKMILVDDLVWLFTKRPNPELNRKFQSFYSGPYRVTKQVSNTLFEIQSYGKWCSEVITTVAAVDRLKKCTIRDPETNEGVPIDLKASDVAPYYEEGEEVLGKIPVSEFAPHIFQDTSPLPFVDRGPIDERDPSTAPPLTLLPADPPNEQESEIPDLPSPPLEKPSDQPTIPDEEVHQPVNAPTEREPIEAPVPIETGRPATPPIPSPAEPVIPRRGRPKGAKTKLRPCPNCVVDGPKCLTHCQACRARMQCPHHSEVDRCVRCTRTRRCRKHPQELFPF